MSYLEEQKTKWNKKSLLSIALLNLAIVATLGTLLRGKILFSIPFINFKNTLHAHSHYAFGGWVTLALLALMIYEIIPKNLYSHRAYKIVFSGLILNAIGMLISFPLQGYGFFSILFSTLFIFTTYLFAWVFIKHLRRAGASNAVKLLSIFSIVYLVASSAGPFTLAYLLATKSANAVIYRDSIYTYLHLQYNGFFTLAVFALFFNRIENTITAAAGRRIEQFSWLLALSVVPSVFLCYLWHYPGTLYRVIASVGSILMVASVLWFVLVFPIIGRGYRHFYKTARNTTTIALAAFVMKMLLQSLTISHDIGAAVFSNRPVIIGFLHLILLGFISLYILGHMVQAGLLRELAITRIAFTVFITGVVANELILFIQGGGIMLMHSGAIYSWLLWYTALVLLAGAILIVIARYRSFIFDTRKRKVTSFPATAKSFSNLNNKPI